MLTPATKNNSDTTPFLHLVFRLLKTFTIVASPPLAPATRPVIITSSLAHSLVPATADTTVFFDEGNPAVSTLNPALYLLDAKTHHHYPTLSVSRAPSLSHDLFSFSVSVRQNSQKQDEQEKDFTARRHKR
ncbi:hypothetical protein L1887_32237 [Cichorium endivia]|nr:hypothetical protein L1887_32237 [Cichorium endivia]